MEATLLLLQHIYVPTAGTQADTHMEGEVTLKKMFPVNSPFCT